MPCRSTICGACHEACPVGIPLHDLLVRVRGKAHTPAHRRDRMRFRLWSRAWSTTLGYGATRVAGRLGLRLLGRRGWVRRLPGPGADWTDQRDVPSRWPPR